MKMETDVKLNKKYKQTWSLIIVDTLIVVEV